MIDLWIDDSKDPVKFAEEPERWLWVRTMDQALRTIWLYRKQLGTIALDYDLQEGTGEDILRWMIEQGIWPTKVELITMNPVGRKRLERLIKDQGATAKLLGSPGLG